MTTYLTLVGFIKQMTVDLLNDINDISGPAIINDVFNVEETYQNLIYGNDSGTYQAALNYYVEVADRLGLTDNFNLFASRVLLGDNNLRSLFRSGWDGVGTVLGDGAYARTVDRIYFSKDLEDKSCGGESQEVQICPDPLHRKKFDVEAYFPSVGPICAAHSYELDLDLYQVISMEKVDALEYKFEIGIVEPFKV